MPVGVSLHIGLNSVDPAHYQGWSGPLRACEADASSMQDIARNQDFKTATLITGAATRDDVAQALAEAASKLVAGDLFLLTYSGHGGSVPVAPKRRAKGQSRERDDETDGRNETWCLYDAEILDDEINLLLSQFKLGVRILVLSDSCHSGTVLKDRLVIARSAKVENRVRAMPPDVAEMTYQANSAFYDAIIAKLGTRSEDKIRAQCILLSACLDHELSLDGDTNGLFTSKVIEVWGSGRFRGDHRSFHEEVRQRVSEAGRQLHNAQSPDIVLYGPVDESYVKSRPFTIEPDNVHSHQDGTDISEDGVVNISYPIKFSGQPGKECEECAQERSSPALTPQIRFQGIAPSMHTQARSSAASTPQIRFEGFAPAPNVGPGAPRLRGVRADVECKTWVLAEIAHWPETKTEMVTECHDLGWPLGRVCVDVPRLSVRDCAKSVVVEICYPAGVWADINDCVRGAAMVGAVAALVASPEAGAAAFDAALKACLAGKAAGWLDQVRVNRAGWDSICTGWH